MDVQPPDGDINKGPQLIVLSWVAFSLALTIVLARMWTRTRIIHAFGWDDASMVLALICASINSALITTSITYGTGRHMFYLNDNQRMHANKFNWLSHGFHVMSTNWGKVSIMLLLLRIVDKAKRQAPYFYAGMILLTTVSVVCVYTIYGQCTPTIALWDPTVKGKCWPPSVQRNYAYFTGDLVLAVYPLFLVSKLQMPTRMKIGLGTILALGLIAMVAAIVKTVNLARLVARADYTWDTFDLAVWLCIEQYLIIIAACIPTLGPLFKMIRRKGSTLEQGSNLPSRYKQYFSGPKSSSRTVTANADGGSTTPGKSRGKYGMSSVVKSNGHPLHTYCDNGQQSNGGSQDAIVWRSEEQADGIMKVREVHVKVEEEEDIELQQGDGLSRPWESRSPV
ncbi:hypothetical protein PRK78_006304 [Emydomyces testavorans]|uniref:Rhodopsin domain-containing protein n=1 Tax=Emydomyces testavorans TaxID=2070801 RepID=A0AAF0DNY0_9EURO|nr:hypothetical protein PRK78_006304 [Emydomyces testavorans]